MIQQVFEYYRIINNFIKIYNIYEILSMVYVVIIICNMQIF